MKNVRPTSIETYHRVIESGLLSKRREQIYSILFKYGKDIGLTGAETFHYFKDEFGGTIPTNSNVNTRLAELRDMGCVTEFDPRTCTKTGNDNYVWIANDNMPVKLVKPTRTKCLNCNGKGYHTQERLL